MHLLASHQRNHAENEDRRQRQRCAGIEQQQAAFAIARGRHAHLRAGCAEEGPDGDKGKNDVNPAVRVQEVLNTARGCVIFDLSVEGNHVQDRAEA